MPRAIQRSYTYRMEANQSTGHGRQLGRIRVTPSRSIFQIEVTTSDGGEEGREGSGGEVDSRGRAGLDSTIATTTISRAISATATTNNTTSTKAATSPTMQPVLRRTICKCSALLCLSLERAFRSFSAVLPAPAVFLTKYALTSPHHCRILISSLLPPQDHTLSGQPRGSKRGGPPPTARRIRSSARPRSGGGRCDWRGARVRVRALRHNCCRSVPLSKPQGCCGNC